jgi:hypothetical protein
LVLYYVFVKPVDENDLPEPDDIDDPVFSVNTVLFLKNHPCRQHSSCVFSSEPERESGYCLPGSRKRFPLQDNRTAQGEHPG